jgi:hypothetical protein
MINVMLAPLYFLAICGVLCMIWKFYRDDKNHITEKEWDWFYLNMHGLYQKYNMVKYGPFYSRWSYKEVEIGEMSIYLKKDDYSFKRHFLKHKSNSYYTVHYMPYGSYTTEIMKSYPEEMMFELYTDLDELIKEFPRLIRDRKKIYKKRIIESICKEKDIC